MRLFTGLPLLGLPPLPHNFINAQFGLKGAFFLKCRKMLTASEAVVAVSADATTSHFGHAGVLEGTVTV